MVRAVGRSGGSPLIGFTLCTSMYDLQQIIDESRPMLEEFLVDAGIYRRGDPIADPQLLERFSNWLSRQHVPDDAFFWLAARVNAFIQEYMIEGHSAFRRIDGNQILLVQPIDAAHGVYREFDTIPVAAGIVRDRSSLKEFLDML
jgi:hypothetical protein